MITKEIADLIEKEIKYENLQNKLFRIVSNYKASFPERMGKALPVLAALLDITFAEITHTIIIAPFDHRETRTISYGARECNNAINAIRNFLPVDSEIVVKNLYKMKFISKDNSSEHIYYYPLEKSLENKVISDIIIVIQDKYDQNNMTNNKFNIRQKRINQTLKTMFAILENGFALEKLGEEKDKLQTILNNIPAGLVSLNRCMYVETWNIFMEKITGLTQQDLRNLAVQELIEKNQNNKLQLIIDNSILPILSDKILNDTAGLISLQKIMSSAYQGREERIDVEGIRFKDRVFTVYYIPRVHDGKKTGLDIIVIDRTYEFVDKGKTELYNYKYYELFCDNLKKRLILGSRLSYYGMMLDLDHFKMINDEYGHDCGDYVLKEVGNIIKTTMNEIVDMAGIPFRLGGEEFYVLIENLNYEEAIKIAEIIRKKIQNYAFQYENKKITVTASIGIAQGDPLEPEITKIQADKALYKAKGINDLKGRNRTAFYNNRSQH